MTSRLPNCVELAKDIRTILEEPLKELWEGVNEMRLIDADKLREDLMDQELCNAPELVYESIREAKEIKAIPIDWILKWANKNCRYCLDYDYPTEKTDGWFDINNMVKDWGKENGLS